jgi:phage terminase Nu1 subunit (DNA packaging protein)
MDPKQELAKLPPEKQQLIELIAEKVAEATKHFNEKIMSDVKQPRWIARAWRELALPKAEPLVIGKVKAKQDSLRRGLLCIMACNDSGFKARKHIKDMDQKEIQTRADLTVTEVLLLQVLVLAAESVISRHGLTKEYTSIVDKVNAELRPMYPELSSEDVERIQALVVKDGGGENGQLSEIGKGSERAVDTEGVRDNKQEPTES